MSALLHRDTATREALLRALDEVPHFFSKLEASAVRAVYGEGRTVKAAAEHLGRNKANVYDQIQRAQRAIRHWRAARESTA